MAIVKLSFFSTILDMDRQLSIALPDTGSNFPVLYLYHGYSGASESWLKELNIETIAKEKGIAVVMPDAWKSYYSNMVTGERYLDHIALEVPELVQRYFHLSAKREDNFVAGFSMGGYGALKVALTYPDKFSYAASISGIVDLNSSSNVNSKLFASIFGENCTFNETEHDLQYLIMQQKSTNGPVPKLYFCCGTEDELLDCNRRFKSFCIEKDLDFQYHEGQGKHDWKYADPHFYKIMNWLPNYIN